MRTADQHGMPPAEAAVPSPGYQPGWAAERVREAGHLAAGRLLPAPAGPLTAAGGPARRADRAGPAGPG